MSTNSSRIERLWQYLEADPCNASLLRDIAREGLATGQHEQAIKALDQLLESKQADANDEAAAIHTLLKLGRVLDAAVRADAAMVNWPHDEALRVESARAWLNFGRHQDALDVCLEPFSDQILACLGGEMALQALWHLGQISDALQLANQLVKAHPDAPRLLALHAALLFDDQQLVPAFEAAHKAHDLSPQHAYIALHVLASEKLMQHDADGARQFIETAQSVNTRDGRIWLLKGSVEMMAGQMDPAIEALNQAIAAFPEHPGSHLTLAWLQVARQDLDKAEESVNTAIAVSPAFAESHGTLAVIKALQGQRDEAERSIRRATLLDRDGFAARYAQKVLDGTASTDISDILTDLAVRLKV